MWLLVNFRSCHPLQFTKVQLFKINNIPLFLDSLSVYPPALTDTVFLTCIYAQHVTRIWKLVSGLSKGLRVCCTCFQKRKEGEKGWQTDTEGERERGGNCKKHTESTISVTISKNKSFPFLICLAFIFLLQNFSIRITWNLKKNNLRFSVDKNFNRQ